MLKLNLHLTKDSADQRCLNVPTSLREIRLDYLNNITSDVKIERYYALIAVCVYGSFEQRFASDKKKDTMGANILLVKKNDPDDVISAKPGELLIMSPQEAMLGNDVAVGDNVLSNSRVMKEVIKAKDNKTITAVKTNLNTLSGGTPYHDFTNPINHIPFYTISFKLVPISAIHASYEDIKKTYVEDMYYHE